MPAFICNILQGASILGLPSCKSYPWKRYTCANDLSVREGEVEERGGVGVGGWWEVVKSGGI